MKYFSGGSLLILAIIFSTCIAATPVEAQMPDSSHYYMAISGNQGWQTLNIKKGSYLKHALKQLKRYYRVVFFYRDDAVTGKKVTRDVTALPGNLDKALKRVLTGQGLVFNQLNDRTYGIYSKKKIALLEGLIIPSTTAHLQPRMYLAKDMIVQQATVSGTVTAAKTGKPLIGVSILVVGTSTGTTTDAKGHYSLKVPSLQDTLRFSYIGYKTKKVPINGRTTVNVTLTSTVKNLNQVVVTALGFKTKKGLVTSSSAPIPTKQLQTSGSRNLLTGMKGLAPGLHIRTSSGRVGSPSRVTIRGPSSILGNNEPLFVIDGIPVASRSIGGVSHQGAGVYQASRIDDINPADIKSIRVLKGPAASAIWGSRGANGVIVITTKTGQNNFKVHFDTKIKLSQANRTISMQQKFGQGFNGNYIWGSRYSWGDLIANRPCTPDVRARPDVKWSKIIDKNSCKTWNHAKDYLKIGVSTINDLSLSGGNDKSNFYISYRYKHNSGILKTGSGQRYNSIRGNFSRSFTPKFTAKLHLNYISSHLQRIAKGNELEGVNISAYRTPPDFNQHPYSITYIDKQGNVHKSLQRTYRSPNGLGPSGYDNPFWLMNENFQISKLNRILGSVFLKYDILEWLSVTERLGIDYYTDFRTKYHAVGGSSFPKGDYRIQNHRRNQINSDLVLHADHQLTEGLFASLLLGWNLNERTAFDVYASTHNLILGFAPPNLNNGQKREISSFRSIKRTAAYYYVLRLRGLNQLFFKFTGRAASSSTFGGENSTFFYPSFSGAWEFTHLDVFDNSALSSGKLRISWGITGIQPPIYSTQTVFNISTFNHYRATVNSIYYGGGVTRSSQRGNPDVKPEKDLKFEVGINLGFFNNRLKFSATEYFNHTRQALLNIKVPLATGFSSVLKNAARMKNIGTELSLKATLIQSKNINWTTNMSWSMNNNTVTFLAGANSVCIPGAFHCQGVAKVGYPYGVIRGTYLLKDDNGNFILDNNGFPIVSSDTKILGDPFADWWYRFNTVFSYKNFTLTTAISVKKGSIMWNRTRGVMRYFGTGGGTTWWTKAKQDLVEYNGNIIPKGTMFRGYVKNFGGGPVAVSQPWFIHGPGSGYSGAASLYIENSGYIRVNHISLSYNLASASFRKFTGLQNLKFTVSAYNPFLITQYKGVDPSTNVTGPGNAQGYDYFSPPSIRSILFSIGINF